jgi:hypothetical protein
MQLYQPQFAEVKQIFQKSDGSIKTLSVVVRKKYNGVTDYLNERLHQRIKIALAHDNVSVECDRYVGDISQDGDYAITWPEFKDYPLGIARFGAFVTPFDAINSNCMTCEEAAQMDLVDDKFPGTLAEGSSHSMNVATNDKICCAPATFAITSYNSDLLDSISIDASGNVSIVMNSPIASGTDKKLGTYRVTCPNGNYDEADITADVSGSLVAACNDPIGINLVGVGTTSATINWTPPSPTPNHYYWTLYIGGVLQTSGTTPAPPFNLSGLTPGTNYKFFVRSQCDATNNDGTASDFVEQDFSTGNETSLCGKYDLQYICALCSPTSHINVSYYDCNGNLTSVYLPNSTGRGICALQSAPGVPHMINAGGDPNFSYTYCCPC